MEYVKVVAYAFIAIQVITACILLWLQLAAFRRYKHPSFRLLGVSTIGALLCLGLLFAPSFIATSPSARLNIFFLSVAVYICYAVLAIAGTVALFRSYGERVRAAEANTR